MTRRARLPSSVEFDDPRYWRFQRDSGLPIGYFDAPRLTVRRVVTLAVVLALVMVGLALTAGEVMDEAIPLSPAVYRR